jgi:hypothetical protein
MWKWLILWLLSFVEVNVQCYWLLWKQIFTKPEGRGEYPSFSKVNNTHIYWNRRQWLFYSIIRYSFFFFIHVLPITSYWSSSSVVIVLLQKILFVLNFYITYVFQYYYLNIKILKFYENWNFWNFLKILKCYENFEILRKFWNFEILNFKFKQFKNFKLRFDWTQKAVERVYTYTMLR